MKLRSIINHIEEVAPLVFQESYDNAGLLIGNYDMEITSALITIDVTEEIVEEAIQKKCNLIISHHPLIFSGIKKILGRNNVERSIIKCIQSNIAVYAAHTNLDNVLNGVNGKIADKLGLINRRILAPKSEELVKLVTYAPKIHATHIRESLFKAGAGHIGKYASCSFNSEGIGTFKANENAQPFVGNIGQLHSEPEIRIEIIIPLYLKDKVLKSLMQSHPYEEPAYDIVPLKNEWKEVGGGLIGDLPNEMAEIDFLKAIKALFGCDTVKYTKLLEKPIKKVALCGGSGSSLLQHAIKEDADIYISGDFKYHEFFQAEEKILIADIGHFESEQFTKDIFYEIITKKIPTFAVLISEIKTNPINYL